MMNSYKKLSKSLDDRVITGVCGGIAEYFDIDSKIVRIIWLLFTLFSGSGIIAYIIGTIIIPEAKGTKKDHRRSTTWIPVIILVTLFFIVQHHHFFQLFWNQFWEFTGSWVISIILLLGAGYYFYIRKPELFKKGDYSQVKSAIYLSSTDRKIAGVCGGVAEYFDFDPTIVRFIWLFGTFVSGGIGLILYIVLVFFLRTNSTEEEV